MLPKNSIPGQVAAPLSSVRIARIFSLGLRYVRGSVRQSIFWLVCAFFGNATASLVPQMLGTLTTSLGQSGSLATGKKAAHAMTHAGAVETYWGWVFLALLAALISYVLKLTSTRLDVGMANQIRQSLFEKMLRADPSFFRQNDSGKINVLLNQTAVEAQQLFRQITLDPVNQALSLVFALTLLTFNFNSLDSSGGAGSFGSNIGAILIIVALGVLGFLISVKTGRNLSQAAAGVRNQGFGLGTLLNDSFASPEEIQAFRAESFLANKFKAALSTMTVMRMRQSKSLGLINLAESAPGTILQIALVGYAVWLFVTSTQSEAANVGAIVAIVGLVPQVLSPIQSLSAYNINIANSGPSVESMDQILNYPEISNQGTRQIPSGTGALVEVDNLVFSYPGGDFKVLDGATFSLHPGKVYGLVSRMGTGKSTLFRLLLRFYSPQSGRLLLDGNAFSDYSLSDLRQVVGYMPQKPVLFTDTIRENLRLANPDATDDELKATCARTGIDNLLAKKREKLIPSGGTYLDIRLEGKDPLSGGETKLLALTRSLMRGPRLMLLDEPTAGMDNLTKQQLLTVLKNETKAITALVVEHDPDWLSELCDEILVLDGGKIVESGSPAELAARPGLFKELLERNGEPQIIGKNPSSDREPSEHSHQDLAPREILP